MHKEQLLQAIELIGKHPYYTELSVKMQIEIYEIGKRITPTDKLELMEKLNPPAEEIIEEVVEDETPVE